MELEDITDEHWAVFKANTSKTSYQKAKEGLSRHKEINPDYPYQGWHNQWCSDFKPNYVIDLGAMRILIEDLTFWGTQKTKYFARVDNGQWKIVRTNYSDEFAQIMQQPWMQDLLLEKMGVQPNP